MSQKTTLNETGTLHGQSAPLVQRYNMGEIFTSIPPNVGRDSSVGIATGYGLDGPGIESLWGARFSAPVQTGPEAHPASCAVGTGSFPGVKSGWGVTLTLHPLLVPWSRKSRAIPLLPLQGVLPVQSLSACTRVTFTFYSTTCAQAHPQSYLQ